MTCPEQSWNSSPGLSDFKAVVKWQCIKIETSRYIALQHYTDWVETIRYLHCRYWIMKYGLLLILWGQCFQNVIIESEGKKNPRGSLTILEYVQTRKVECKIAPMMWLQPCENNLCIWTRMGRELRKLYLFVWRNNRLSHFHVIFIQQFFS